MGEALRRIAYDATVDDAVDVSLRLANRTHAFRRQVRQNVIAAGIAFGLIFFAGWTYFAGARSLWEFVLAVGAGLGFGLLCAWMFKHELFKQIVKQQRKVVAEQFGGKSTIASEMELRSDAVWVRQAGMEMLFPWSLCSGVVDNAEDIEMNFAPGICVVRNRHFATPAERQLFLETARQLAAGAVKQD